MNKYLKWGLPMAIGTAAAAVPVGYLTYAVTHPIVKDGSEMTRFWGQFDQKFLNTFEVQLTQELDDVIRDGYTLIHSLPQPLSRKPEDIPVLMQNEDLNKLVNDFRAASMFLSDYSSVFDNYGSIIDEETFKVLVDMKDQQDFWINEKESSKDSPLFGYGYDLTIFDLFDKVIPGYISKITTRIPSDIKINPKITRPSTLSYDEFTQRYRGGNINENTDVKGVDADKYYKYTLIDPVSTFEYDYYIRSYFDGNGYQWFVSKDGVGSLAPYPFDSGKYTDLMNTLALAYENQPFVQAVLKQNEQILAADSTFAKNSSFYGKFIEDLFTTDVVQMNPEDVLTTYYKAIGKTYDAVNNVWSTTPLLPQHGQRAPLFDLLDKDFPGIFDAFINAQNPHSVKVADIPALMGYGTDEQFSFEFGIAEGAKYTNGNVILNDNFVGDERLNTHYIGDNPLIYSDEYLKNTMSDQDIINIFWKGGL